MRLGAIVRCFYLTDYLERVLKNLFWLDRVIVAHSYPSNSDVQNDRTVEIVKQLAYNNVDTYTFLDKQQHEVFNDALKIFYDYDYVFINDADEFLLPVDQIGLIRGIKKKKADVGYINVIDYSQDINKRYPIRTHRPAVIVRPHVHFYEIRNIVGEGYFHKGYMHHMGYAFTQDKINWKLKNKQWYGVDEKNIQNILNQPLEDCTPPKELLELLNE